MSYSQRFETSLPIRTKRLPKVALVSGGLGAYWDQFPQLLPQLKTSATRIAKKLGHLNCQVLDIGFISDAQEGAMTAERLQKADCDLIICFLATYMTATMVAPIVQRSNTPVLFINLQPSKAMDHSTFGTEQWLAYCGACPLPEMGNVFKRMGIPFHSISGYLEDQRAWKKIEYWIKAAGAKGVLRSGRFGLMGNLYPGMIDVSTDLALISSQLGGHVEILEFDDLRVRVEGVTNDQIRDRIEIARQNFDMENVMDTDLEWAAQVSVGLDLLVKDFALDSLAYYHRGLNGEIHEQLGAGMILGASLLTARGIPVVGEYELRTSLAMLVLDQMGAGGSFTEFQALNFEDEVVEMGHDGPGHLAISDRRPLLRGLDIYHGKRGKGVSVEFDVKQGPVTTFGIGQVSNSALVFVASKGTVVDGPLLQIGNTTSRVDFNCNPGEWTDAWSASGVGHHWALGIGHCIEEIRCLAQLLGQEFIEIEVG